MSDIKSVGKVPESKALLFWELFKTFFILGSFTIGGGLVMIPLIEKELVQKKGWLSDVEFLDMIALVQIAPGVMAVNSAVIIGYRFANISGAIVSALGAVLPSFFMILIIASFFVQFNTYPYLKAFLEGARPAVIALLLYASLDLGKKAVTEKKALFILGIGFLALYLIDIHPIILIILAGILGFLFYQEGRN